MEERNRYMPSDLIMINPLIKKVSGLKKNDKFYESFFIRMERLFEFADFLYYYNCKKKNHNFSQLGYFFESFVLYMRTIFDFMYIVLEKETNIRKKIKNKEKSLNTFLKKIKKDDFINEIKTEVDPLFCDFIFSDTEFIDFRNLRNSIKGRTTFLNVSIKKKELFLQGEYFNDEKKEKVDFKKNAKEFVWSMCCLVSKWSFVINNLAGFENDGKHIIKNRRIT